MKEIKNPPKTLWYDGDISLLNKNSIAIIGARKCTEYGEIWCEKFIKGLLKYNLIIVSGMANGIDSIAHKATLKYGGKTIAVLPSGLKNIYPKCNEDLYNQIIQSGGLVISEYEPSQKANSRYFIERNRIVSGISIGVLVIEAAYRSGTSITASIATTQGKKVFCIPR